MKKLFCLCLALCLLAGLSACKKTPKPEITTRENATTRESVTTQSMQAIDPEDVLSASIGIDTPEQADAFLSYFDGYFVPDEALRAYVSCLRRTAYAFTEENDWYIPEDRDPELPLFRVEAFDEGESHALLVSYGALGEALRGRLSEGGAAWLAELAADGAEALWSYGYLQVSFDELAGIIVRKAAFETKHPGFITQWNDETPDWDYTTTAMDLLEEYLHGNKTVGHPGADFRNGPADPDVIASFEAFLANEAYRDCVYYDMVRAVYGLLEANNWAYDDEVREGIDGVLGA